MKDYNCKTNISWGKLRRKMDIPKNEALHSFASFPIIKFNLNVLLICRNNLDLYEFWGREFLLISLDFKGVFLY